MHKQLFQRCVQKLRFHKIRAYNFVQIHGRQRTTLEKPIAKLLENITSSVFRTASPLVASSYRRQCPQSVRTVTADNALDTQNRVVGKETRRSTPKAGSRVSSFDTNNLVDTENLMPKGRDSTTPPRPRPLLPQSSLQCVQYCPQSLRTGLRTRQTRLRTLQATTVRSPGEKLNSLYFFILKSMK